MTKSTKNLGSISIDLEVLSLFAFRLSSIFVIFCCGFIVREMEIFPYQFFTAAKAGFNQVRDSLTGRLPWYYTRLETPFPQVESSANQPYPGLNLVTKLAADHNLSAEIIDLDGNSLHSWDVNWFEMWPDPQHLPEESIPRKKPGTHIHGAVVMENGDLIFNFENLGLIRINPDGEVVWRLDYITHHSIHRHNDGNLWVSGRQYHTEKISRLPHLEPPFFEETILEVTPDGEILREWYVAEILRENGYDGLLYLGTLDNTSTYVTENTDIFHLNDVEPFPLTMEEDFFQQGDVMVSLRNINAVFVFNSENNEIKFMSSGQFVRQHDPDFIDGNTISVFDNNNNSALTPEELQSRILIISARENSSEVFFEGTPENPFFTHIMGKHQWQANGNLLITDSVSGRGFEVDQQGNIVWQYVNYVDDGVVGIVEEVQRLPLEYNQLYLEQE
ncbi:MAG: arylsulfotransferase family protein [Cyanobacteria bacterium P01_C01_bin.120]